ncbi:MAG: hypothetical protein HY659_14485 [Rhizobiales bacterium]|nr:hypothetical protein [Hyphomicrobiales bacterium]
MATTLLSGLAIFSFDAAQAGPNSIPNSIGGGGFSSMRMDFGRIGSPTANRMIAPEDRRIVPLDVKKTTKKDDKKNAKKKGTDIASVGRIQRSVNGVSVVPNQTPSTGGEDKPGVQNDEPELQLNDAIAGMFHITGGNLQTKFDEFADRLGIGPLVVNVPWASDGGAWQPPVDLPGYPGQGNQVDWNAVTERAFNPGTTPGGPDTSKAGWAAGDPWRVHERGADGSVVYYNKEQDAFQRETDNGNGTWSTTEWRRGENESLHGRTTTGTNESVDVKLDPVVITAGESDPDEAEEPSNEPDSQPAEGGGFRGGYWSGWCSPIGGCNRVASGSGSPRVLPREAEGSGTTGTTRRSNPLGWASDPANPDGLGSTSGGSGGRTGYTPQDEGDGDNGRPGNPD